ncbi:hypothetical protein [Inquilinus sp. OTU3971]|uniref:hypothetical protein n=1 Tax=Inquilinus sp. OTU3971 TaxID=3043855 RepID=UPI00313AE598
MSKKQPRQRTGLFAETFGSALSEKTLAIWTDADDIGQSIKTAAGLACEWVSLGNDAKAEEYLLMVCSEVDRLVDRINDQSFHRGKGGIERAKKAEQHVSARHAEWASEARTIWAKNFRLSVSAVASRIQNRIAREMSPDSDDKIPTIRTISDAIKKERPPKV